MAHFSLGLVDDTFWSSILGFEVVGLEVGLQRRMKKFIENVKTTLFKWEYNAGAKARNNPSL